VLSCLSLGQSTAWGQDLPRPAKPQADGANLANKKIKLPLRTLTAENLHARLEKVLRRRLATSQDSTKKWLGFNIEQAAGQPVTIWASTVEKRMELSGPPPLVDAWQKVIAALDAPAQGSNITELIATQPNAQAKVQQA